MREIAGKLDLQAVEPDSRAVEPEPAMATVM